MLGYKKLLTEKCKYEKFSKNNKFNEKEYKPEEELSCFTSFDFSNDRNRDQQDTRVTKKVFIDSTFVPNVYDRVDDMEIKEIKPVKGLKAPVIGWEIIV